MTNKSKCCGGDLLVRAHTTKYWICDKCKQPSEPGTETEQA